MIAVGRDRPSTLAQNRGYLVFSHYFGHAPLKNNHTIGPEVLVDALGSVAFFASPEEGFDLWEKLHIPGFTTNFPLIRGVLTGQKAIEPTPGYLEVPTQYGTAYCSLRAVTKLCLFVMVSPPRLRKKRMPCAKSPLPQQDACSLCEGGPVQRHPPSDGAWLLMNQTPQSQASTSSVVYR